MIYQGAVESEIDAANHDMTAVVTAMQAAGFLCNGPLVVLLWKRYSGDQQVSWAYVDYPRINRFVEWIKTGCRPDAAWLA